MRRTTIPAIFTVFLLIATMIPLMLDDVQAGAPIFSASRNILEGDMAGNTHIPMDMEIDPDGRMYLLYEGNPEFYYGAYLTFSDDKGVTWSEPVRVDDVLRDNNESNDVNFMEHRVHPRMDIGPNGTVYVVWEDYSTYNEDPAFDQPTEVKLSFSEDGVTFGRSIRVSPPPADRSQDTFSPDIAVNADGRIVVIWMDERDVGAKANLYSSYSDDGGTVWSDLIMINNDDPYNHQTKIRNPRLAIDGDHVYVTWHDNRDTLAGTKPYFSASHDGGETYLPEVTFTDDLVEGNVRDMAYPAVTGSGDLIITWTDERSDKNEVWYVTSDDNGGNFTSDKRLIDPPEDTEDMDPFVATFGSDRVFVLWEREVSYLNTNGNPGTEVDVYYTSSTDGGDTWDQFLRVDDSDRYSENRKSQDSPVGVYADTGRVVVAYGDSPYMGGYTRDLKVTRHSKTLTGVVHYPEILDIGYMGDAGFNESMGNLSTVFTFNMTYKDADNDEPREGFPRISVFRDAAGNDPVFQDLPVMEKTLGPGDVYYMDGVDYRVNVTLPEEGQFYWRMETADESDPEIIRSEIMKGPLIDLTMPTIEILGPTPEIWNSSQVVTCRIRVTDTGGAGVDLKSIKYQKSLAGPDNYEIGVRMTSFNIIDNDTVEATAKVTMYSGKNNYLKFEAKDRLGNGPYLTGSLNMWLDPDAPYFENVRPLANDTKIYPEVNCSITVRDSNEGNTNVDFTGVDPTSLRYAYKTTSDDFSEWMIPDGYREIDNGTYRVWATIVFPDEGVHSQVKWLAVDNIGNVVESRPFFVSVDVPDNYRPVFVGRAWPDVVVSETPHFWWDEAFDEDGDPLYYQALILKNNLNWVDWVNLGHNTFYDLADANALDPGHYVVRIRVTDTIGGEDFLDHHFQIKDQGPEPPSMVPEFGPFFTTDSSMVVSWNATDLEGSDYFFRVGSYHLAGDVIDWQELGDSTSYDMSSLSLGIGEYSLQVMAWGNDNYSRVRTSLFKISDYQLRIDVPETHMAYRGKDFALSGPVEGAIINLGTLTDNVTLSLQGEPVDAGWVYFESTGDLTAEFFTLSSKDLEEEIPVQFRLVVSPEERTPKREYNFTITATSEDGETITIISNVLIDVKDAPSEDTSTPLTEDITSLLPFLENVPEGLVIPLFLLIIILIIALIVTIGILVVRFVSRKRKETDPLSDRIRNYKALYGEDPSPEEVEKWKAELEGISEESVSDEIEKGSIEMPEEEEIEDGSSEPEQGAEVEDDTNGLDDDEKDLIDRLFD